MKKFFFPGLLALGIALFAGHVALAPAGAPAPFVSIAHAASSGYGCEILDETTGNTSIKCSTTNDCSDITTPQGDNACDSECILESTCQNNTATPPPAGGTASGGITIQNPLSCSDLTSCLSGFLGKLDELLVPIVAILILIGGFQIMASGGNEEKLSAGKKTIIYTIIGYAIVLLSSGVAALIQNILTSTPAKGS